MTINIEISVGELIDRMTILEIKSEKIHSADKLKNINKELSNMKQTWASSPYIESDINSEYDRLKEINEKLWEIEDDIREKEAKVEFDEGFIELARSIYINNDERARIKREINEKLGSDIIEEKSYSDYRRK